MTHPTAALYGIVLEFNRVVDAQTDQIARQADRIAELEGLLAAAQSAAGQAQAETVSLRCALQAAQCARQAHNRREVECALLRNRVLQVKTTAGSLANALLAAPPPENPTTFDMMDYATWRQMAQNLALQAKEAL